MNDINRVSSSHLYTHRIIACARALTPSARSLRCTACLWTLKIPTCWPVIQFRVNTTSQGNFQKTKNKLDLHHHHHLQWLLLWNTILIVELCARVESDQFQNQLQELLQHHHPAQVYEFLVQKFVFSEYICFYTQSSFPFNLYSWLHN